MTPAKDLERGGTDPKQAKTACVDVEKLEQRALETLVRTALASCIEGTSGRYFQRSLARIQLAGGVVGDKFNTRDFLKGEGGQDEVRARSQVEVRARSGRGQGEVRARSGRGQGEVRARSG